ncbi:ABC transporter substrate-binding protein [Methanothrix sp.]|uniref:ABC transporter substrate-binding protein n=1 Tax=Methanothrix sp. TaxID=90426 RepID=UPI003C7495DB
MKRTSLELLLAVGLLASIASSVAADFTLEIFGNANMDETIDDADIAYVEEVIRGTKESTNLTDANNDGTIDERDIEQIRQIIDGSAKELTFIDYDGVLKTVHLPVRRIIPTYSYITWGVEMLGAKDRIIAVDESVRDEELTVFPDLKDLPSIGSSSDYDKEKIIELQPDAVLVFTRKWLTAGSNPNLEKDIEAACPNCTVFALMPRNIGTFKAEMAKLSYILGNKDAGNELIQWYEGYMGNIAAKIEEIPEEDRPRLFHTDNDQLAAGKTSYHTYGRDSEDVSLVLDEVGGSNIAKDMPGDWIEVDAEWVLTQNPDVIIITDWNNMGYAFDDPAACSEVRESFMSRPELKNTGAVRDGRVYLINWDTVVTEWFIAIPYLAKLLHPDIFQDLDPEGIHQEFLTRFRGLDYDLNEYGVFVYPPIESERGLAGVPDRYKEQG